MSKRKKRTLSKIQCNKISFKEIACNIFLSQLHWSSDSQLSLASLTATLLTELRKRVFNSLLGDVFNMQCAQPLDSQGWGYCQNDSCVWRGPLYVFSLDWTKLNCFQIWQSIPQFICAIKTHKLSITTSTLQFIYLGIIQIWFTRH